MADSVQYDDKEVRDLLEKAGAVFLEGTPAYTAILERGGRKAGSKGEELGGEYPDQPRRPLNPYYQRVHVNTTTKPRPTDGQPFLSKFKTQKQAGYFFASLTAGDIRVPYHRNGFLGASLGHEVEVTSNGVNVEIGTSQDYAPLVIGNESEQSYYHTQTGWQSLDDQLDEGSDVILEAFIEGVVEGVEAYLAG